MKRPWKSKQKKVIRVELRASGGPWVPLKPGWSAGDMEIYDQHCRMLMMNKQ